MTPRLVIIGADKGGVGKTTVTSALLDYLEKNHQGDVVRAFDTEPEPGRLKIKYPAKTEVVDFTVSSGIMRVLDTMMQTPLTVIDTKAGILSDTLQLLENIGTLDKAKNGDLKITLLHVLGGTRSSFDEIKGVAEKLLPARHCLVKNHINDNSFFKWDPEMAKFLQGGVIEVPKLDALAGEHVDAAGVGFAKFRDDPTRSETLRGFVRYWLSRVFIAFDAAQLNAL
jgi:hypothetical protein